MDIVLYIAGIIFNIAILVCGSAFIVLFLIDSLVSDERVGIEPGEGCFTDNAIRKFKQLIGRGE